MPAVISPPLTPELPIYYLAYTTTSLDDALVLADVLTPDTAAFLWSHCVAVSLSLLTDACILLMC